MNPLFTHGQHVCIDCFVSESWCFLIINTVLDPRISYGGMKADYADDQALSEYLEDSKSKLFGYFNENYMKFHGSTLTQTPSPARGTTTALTSGSPQKCFTARYRRRENVTVNELEEYFKLPPEDFEKCNPIKWWVGRRAQFPNLFCLARDIICIPGMCHAVAISAIS
jgi:hypothetical protein